MLLYRYGRNERKGFDKVQIKTVDGYILEVDPKQVESRHLSTESYYWFEGVRLLPTLAQEQSIILAEILK